MQPRKTAQSLSSNSPQPQSPVLAPRSKSGSTLTHSTVLLQQDASASDLQSHPISSKSKSGSTFSSEPVPSELSVEAVTQLVKKAESLRSQVEDTQETLNFLTQQVDTKTAEWEKLNKTTAALEVECDNLETRKRSCPLKKGSLVTKLKS